MPQPDLSAAAFPDIQSLRHLSKNELTWLQNCKPPYSEFHKMMQKKLPDDSTLLTNEENRSFFSMHARIQYINGDHLVNTFLEHNPKFLSSLLKLLSYSDKSIVCTFQLKSGNTLLHSVLEIPGGEQINLIKLIDGELTPSHFNYMLGHRNREGHSGLRLVLTANIEDKLAESVIDTLTSWPQDGDLPKITELLDLAFKKPAAVLALLNKFPQLSLQSSLNKSAESAANFRNFRQFVVGKVEALIFKLYDSNPRLAHGFFVYFNQHKEFKRMTTEFMAITIAPPKPTPLPAAIQPSSWLPSLPSFSSVSSSLSNLVVSTVNTVSTTVYGTPEKNFLREADPFEIKILVMAALCCSSESTYMALFSPSTSRSDSRVVQPPCSAASLRAVSDPSFEEGKEAELLSQLLCNIPKSKKEYLRRYNIRKCLDKTFAYLVERFLNSGTIIARVSEVEARKEHFIAGLALLYQKKLDEAKLHFQTASLTFGAGRYTKHCTHVTEMLNSVTALGAYQMVETLKRFCRRLQPPIKDHMQPDIPVTPLSPFEADLIQRIQALKEAPSTDVNQQVKQVNDQVRHSATFNPGSLGENNTRTSSLNAYHISLTRTPSLGMPGNPLMRTPSLGGPDSLVRPPSLGAPNSLLIRTPSLVSMQTTSLGNNPQSLPAGTPMSSIGSRNSSLSTNPDSLPMTSKNTPTVITIDIPEKLDDSLENLELPKGKPLSSKSEWWEQPSSPESNYDSQDPNYDLDDILGKHLLTTESAYFTTPVLEENLLPETASVYSTPTGSPLQRAQSPKPR